MSTNTVELYGDACVQAPEYPLNEKPRMPEGFSGAVLFGGDSKLRLDECYRWFPDLWWQHGEDLDRIVSETNARFPSRASQVIDLNLDPARLMQWLKNPTQWWPLCESLRNTSRYLRLHLPRGTSALVGAKQVISRFPDTNFWIDPFVHGPSTGWQGHVRLAGFSNVILSTLGLASSEHSLWKPVEAQAALHYAIGEVGASVLVYASGLEWDDVVAGLDRPFREWIAESPDLDQDERRMVLYDNAKDIFESYRHDATLV